MLNDATVHSSAAGTGTGMARVLEVTKGGDDGSGRIVYVRDEYSTGPTRLVTTTPVVRLSGVPPTSPLLSTRKRSGLKSNLGTGGMVTPLPAGTGSFA